MPVQQLHSRTPTRLHHEGLTASAWCSGVSASLGVPKCPSFGRFGSAGQCPKTLCVQAPVAPQPYEQSWLPVSGTTKSTKWFLSHFPPSPTLKGNKKEIIWLNKISVLFLFSSLQKHALVKHVRDIHPCVTSWTFPNFPTPPSSRGQLGGKGDILQSLKFHFIFNLTRCHFKSSLVWRGLAVWGRESRGGRGRSGCGRRLTQQLQEQRRCRRHREGLASCQPAPRSEK